MEQCLHLLEPETLTWYSYVAGFAWFVVFVVFIGPTSDFYENESRVDFKCKTESLKDNAWITKQCFGNYEKDYMKIIPLFVFVLINFFVILLVFVIYSCFTKRRVERIKNHETNDAELQPLQPTQPENKTKLVWSYIGQLTARILLGIIFMVSQTGYFYPYGFPSNFECRSIKRQRNSTAVVFANITYDCYNQAASKKKHWVMGLLVVNGVFAFVAFVEFLWVLYTVKRRRACFNDLQFYQNFLGGSNKQQLELSNIISKMKKNFLEHTKSLPDLRAPFRSNPGEGPQPHDLDTDKIYVNVTIHENRATMDFPHERSEQLKVYPPKRVNDTCELTQIADIIDAEHKNVLVVGRPGIGKTMMCTRLLRLWAESKSRDEVALSIAFRNVSSTSDINIRDLLTLSTTTQGLDDNEISYILNYITLNPSKLILYLDGVDEFSSRSNISQSEDSELISTDGKMAPHILFRKIWSRKLLRKATVITTTRPTAVECLRNLPRNCLNRTVEILGFSFEQVKDYVTKFAESQPTIWEHIQQNANLHSLCYIPVNCFIICHCLLQILLQVSTSSDHLLPVKITEIYSMFLKIFFHMRNNNKAYLCSKCDLGKYMYKPFKDLKPENEDVFKPLGKLAFEGIRDRKLIFESDKIDAALLNCGLLHSLPKIRSNSLVEPSKQYFCFIHLTLQEFLAAKHVTDTYSEEDLKSFVENHINDGAWQIVTRFVAGLSNTHEVTCRLLPERVTDQKEWPVAEDTTLAVDVCHCLYESASEMEAKALLQGKLERMDLNIVDFSQCGLGPADMSAVVNVLKHAPYLNTLLMPNNNIGLISCKEVLTLLQNFGNKLTKLYLTVNSIGDEGAKYIGEALRHENCKLTKLNISNNNIGDEGAKYIGEALGHENCKLTKLNISNNNIGDKGAKYIGEALANESCKLTQLDISFTNIGVGGVKYIGEALAHENCKLTHLNMRRNNIGDEGAKYIGEALGHENCKLTKLNISKTNIGDEGAKYIGEALGHENCKLTKWDMCGNNIGDEGAKYIGEALSHENCKLTQLYIGLNNIGGEGAKYIGEALSHENCKLTQLYIGFNNIGDEGAKYIGEALRHENCKLTQLFIGFNNIGDEGAKYIGEASRHKNCKITKLNIVITI
ncbi:NLR family CARD domain-containing protein 3-like [Nematostella vectensis]|uniref:NLR family CARD domain-containing protein 3-like n=1 Tax=Nematostella vectensis TaxID=45351 RepID=UPI0020776308|nr:NLR family CARD domain-containing protein 3-like [Nematostella vectensis]